MLKNIGALPIFGLENGIPWNSLEKTHFKMGMVLRFERDGHWNDKICALEKIELKQS